MEKPFSRLRIIVARCLLTWTGVPQAWPLPGNAPWESRVVASTTLRSGGASVQVDFGSGTLDLPRERVLFWVQTAADSVSSYYGRFPVRTARVLILPVPEKEGVRKGTTWGDVGGFPAFTRVLLGERTTTQELDRDWMLTHELIHMAFPTMADEHHWIEEGLATYVEPIARAQRGLLEPEAIWADMLRDMPKGDPGALDRGLDRTHTWGRTYWGGAQFCLLADVTIRQKTANRKGLEDALRAIVAAGGTIDRNWTIERALKVGDDATGTTVLQDLYREMGKAPAPIDLEHMWTELGVAMVDGKVVFNNRASEAAVREAITRKPAVNRP